MNLLPAPNFEHLLALRGPHGVYEHAEKSVPRIEGGYCTDDVARVALVLARQGEKSLSFDLSDLLWSSMEFLELAQSPTGEFVNRRESSGDFELGATSNDWWGRAMWALGTIYAHGEDSGLRERARRTFESGAVVRSPWPRSMAFATLGAHEYLQRSPENAPARLLLEAGASLLDRENVSARWRWPEARLSYANAVLPEALIAAGAFTGEGRLVERGLDQLRWLLERETPRGHLSVTPCTGRGPRDARRLFDQQPIEVAAMSDACVRAFALTGDPVWRQGRELCEMWFSGHNDLGVVMFDADTGGGYDGLTANGPNLNQGAESTLALLSTQQHARRVSMSSR
ncbi:MAG: glycosyltransferase [Acidimicrobiaceae bacterium]|nr:glycosyltransferase [Acidimicrobiaceae bacterium]